MSFVPANLSRPSLDLFIRIYIVSDTVRISVPIDLDLHDKLHKLLPWGTKAEVIRQLLVMLIEAQISEPETYIVQDLLRGNCKLVVQNLNRETK